MGLYRKCPSWSWKKNEWIFNLHFWTGTWVLPYCHVCVFVLIAGNINDIKLTNHFWVYNSMALVTFVACAVITISHFQNFSLTPNSSSITMKYWLSIQFIFLATFLLGAFSCADFRIKRMLEILLRVRKEYRGQHQEALGFSQSQVPGCLRSAAQHWALGVGHGCACGVGGTSLVGRGSFPRGRWLHSHSEIKGNEGHDGDKWPFLRIRCVWLFLLKLQYGPICYSWNSLQWKQCSCIRGTTQSWETSKVSVFFTQSAISSWKYPPLRWIWHASREFLRIRSLFSSRDRVPRGLSVLLWRQNPTYLVLSGKKKCFCVLKAMWLALETSSENLVWHLKAQR